jgi:hypothetical protein
MNQNTQKPMNEIIKYCECKHPIRSRMGLKSKDKPIEWSSSETCQQCAKPMNELEKTNNNQTWEACLGVPGCNHPIGQDCTCPCHKNERTNQNWEERFDKEHRVTEDGGYYGDRFVDYIVNRVINLLNKQRDE